MSINSKIFSKNKSKGNRGEAIFESLISQYAIPHKIDCSKDLGVDFICEWIKDKSPTGVIFTAQIKYFPSKRALLQDTDQRLNMLEIFKIVPTFSIDPKTLDYWRLLGLPCYLFIVIPNGNSVDLFYKRYTPVVTGKASQSEQVFYKVNNHFSFFAYADALKKIGGFARDLYIDQMRSNYNRGLIAYLNPRRLGLNQFPDKDSDVYFRDIFQEYKTNFINTFNQLRTVFEESGEQQAIPSKASDAENE